MNIRKPRHLAAKMLVRLANRIEGMPSNGYHLIDNINFYSDAYIRSYDIEQPIKQIWEDWIDVTSENAQEVIDDLEKAVVLQRTKDEQKDLN